MLISKSLMFIHYPRTGGASIQDWIQQAVPDRYFPLQDENLNDGKKTWVMHQGIDVAFQYAHHLGFDPTALPALVCIRNPYSLALSGFMYLNQKWKHRIPDLENNSYDYLANLWAKTSAEKKAHWAKAKYGQFSDYLLVNGSIPQNLTIARTESLQKDVKKFLRKSLGIRATVPFPHRNASQHEHFSQYFSAREEQLVYEMWKNAFRSGLYDRYDGLRKSRLK